MDNLWRDVRYGARIIFNNPGFAALAVLILTLGIGVNTAIFSLVNALLLRPLLMDNPHQIVGLYSKNTQKPDSYRSFSYPNYLDIRERNTVFASLAAHELTIVGIAQGDSTRRAFAELVSSNYFSTFGVPLFRGREFTPDEERPGSEIAVAIVSYGYWNKKGRDPDLVGKTIRINSELYAIVGIAADGFTGTTAMLLPDVWLPLGMHGAIGPDLDGERRDLSDRGYNRLFVVGRMDSGLTPSEADPQLGLLAAQLEEEFPEENKDQTLITHPRSRLGLTTRPNDLSQVTAASMLLSAMAGVVLLIACLNLANMMLARATSRRKEIAIRLALGGSRGQLIRQLLTEGALLSLAGGAMGFFLAYWGMRLLTSSLEAVMPFGIVVASSEANLVSAVRREIRTMDERIPILTLTTFREYFDSSVELWLVQTGARLFSLFGALALFLAAAGVYGVRAYMVAQRTREIGIRMALGATRHDAVSLVLREGLSLTLWGIGSGLVLAFAAGQALSSMLYQVSSRDPVVFVGAPLVLGVFSLLACYVPARRAAMVDTMAALRHE